MMLLPDVEYRTFPGFNPLSSKLVGPFPMFGACLPEFPSGRSLLLADYEQTPTDGDYVLVGLASPSVRNGELTLAAKRLMRAAASGADERWLLTSDEGEHDLTRLGHAIAAIAVITAVAVFGPSWPMETTAQPDLREKLRGWEDQDVSARYVKWPMYPLVPSPDAVGFNLLAATPRKRDLSPLPPLGDFR